MPPPQNPDALRAAAQSQGLRLRGMEVGLYINLLQLDYSLEGESAITLLELDSKCTGKTCNRPYQVALSARDSCSIERKSVIALFGLAYSI